MRRAIAVGLVAACAAAAVPCCARNASEASSAPVAEIAIAPLDARASPGPVLVEVNDADEGDAEAGAKAYGAGGGGTEEEPWSDVPECREAMALARRCSDGGDRGLTAALQRMRATIAVIDAGFDLDQLCTMMLGFMRQRASVLGCTP